MNPRISVVIATYNRASLLKTAIESVLNQTFIDYELIIVDDGSIDDTRALVQSYGDRVRYIFQDNQGKSVALNKAVAVARGEWVALLDSDDYWLPEKLELQIRAVDNLRKRNCGACFTDGTFINNSVMTMTLFEFYQQRFDCEMGVVPDHVQAFARSSSGVSVVTMMCRTDLIQAAGGFDPALRFTEDYDFIFRLALKTNYCFVNRPLVVIDRSAATERHSGASAIWDNIEFRLQCEQYRYEKWLKLSAGLPPEIRRIILNRLRCVHSSWANWHMANENFELAQRELIQAAKYEFSLRIIAKWVLARIAPAFARTVVMKRELFHSDAVH